MKKEDHILKWRLHSKSRSFKSKVSNSMRIIDAAISKNSYCLSWSAGKDSTVMTHLARSMDDSLPILTQFDDCDWPEKIEYANRIRKMHGFDYISVEPDFSIWDAACRFRIGHDNICAQSHSLTRDGFISVLDDARIDLGCNGVMLGLRMEESRSRKLNLCKRGHTYELKNRTMRCNPLSIWNTYDVFAYMVINEIEINPCYFKNRIFKPEDIRLSWALPTLGGMTRGDMEHLKIYYPKQYARLRDMGVV